MTETIALSSLSVGDSLWVIALNGEENMRCRLKDLGVVENTLVRCVMVSPLGDPKAYEIRGAVIALRKEDSENILGIRYKPFGGVYE